MPLSAKEKMKNYRERLKRERPEEHEAQRKRNLERIKSKKKKISEMTAADAEEKRKKWREEKRRNRRKKQDEPRQIGLKPKENIISSTSEIIKKNENNNNQISKLKFKLKMAQQKCKLVTKQNQCLKNKYEIYKKRYYRVQQRSLICISRLESTIEKMKAREEILETTLKKSYNSCQNNEEKRILKSLVLKSTNKSFMSNLLGLKNRARVAKRRLKYKEISEIISFYTRDDVSRSTAGKKECRVKNKEKQQIRYLLDSLYNLYTKYKEEGGKYHFTTFYKQKPFYVLSPHLNSRNTCLCIRHSNIDFQYEVLRRHGIIKETLKELLSQLVCKMTSYECIYGKCMKCKDKTIKFLQNEDILHKTVNWNQWERQEHKFRKKDGHEVLTKKTVKANKTGTIEELISNFSQDLVSFKKHHFNMIHQSKEYQKLVSSLKDNEALIVCDFSENYETKLSNEIQSMHFGASKSQISWHTLMVYWKSSAQSFCTISDNTSHQPAAIWAHLTPVLDLIKEKTPDVDVIHFYSDGPSSQYKQKQNFYLHSHFTSQYALRYSTWSFFEASHGKSVADAIGGVVKRILDAKVCHGKDITKADDVYNVLRKCNTRVEVLLIEEAKINEISSLIPNKLAVLHGTMKLHQIITNDNDTVKYRDISCFCGPLRGNCTCFMPKFHTLRYNNNKIKSEGILTKSADLSINFNKPRKETINYIYNTDDGKSLDSHENITEASTNIVLDDELFALNDFEINDGSTYLDNLSADDIDINLLPMIILPQQSTCNLSNNNKKYRTESKICCRTETKASKSTPFLECRKCSCSIFTKITKCMVCKNKFCQECAGNQYQCIDFLCDPCLQDDDEEEINTSSEDRK